MPTAVNRFTLINPPYIGSPVWKDRTDIFTISRDHSKKQKPMQFFFMSGYSFEKLLFRKGYKRYGIDLVHFR
jgi:hypothetical protein